jgi:hypothetical protein
VFLISEVYQNIFGRALKKSRPRRSKDWLAAHSRSDKIQLASMTFIHAG